MAFGTLELTRRPLKLAFLVDPADTAALTEAIQINTFLWGGMFNPIAIVRSFLLRRFRLRSRRTALQSMGWA